MLSRLSGLGKGPVSAIERDFGALDSLADQGVHGTDNRKPTGRLKSGEKIAPQEGLAGVPRSSRSWWPRSWPAHNLPRLVARILLNRGLGAGDDILAFLDPTLERLNPPFELPDLEVAAARLGRAVRQGEPVAVYGDYDADGITATAVLHQFLRELGLTCYPYIPDRLTQGYGLKLEALKELAEQARLVVTVDCGISDVQEVAWAKAQGLEVIITDHHEIPPELPDALAVVNPKRVGHAYPFGELAGVGVALLLALGVRADLRAEGWFSRRPEPNLRSYLDLVALGTAADVVPLVGENRILVRQGLKVLEESRRPGIIALKEVTQLEGKPISYQNVVFQLAPRLNAAGRMGQARCALELLLSDDLAQARVQARYLHNLNRQRQALEEEVLKQARAMIHRRGLAARPVLVLAEEGWHPGVIGIVAARLAEEYHRPAALVQPRQRPGPGLGPIHRRFSPVQGAYLLPAGAPQIRGACGRRRLRSGRGSAAGPTRPPGAGFPGAGGP